ncbi:MAG: alpha/beta fold hydrolase, partial [Acidobacteria bacterium]|nr:alpha/beta fold hydrolase [Acidobacteriota bacterium]
MKTRTRRWLFVYLLALGLSHGVRVLHTPAAPVRPEDQFLEVPEVGGGTGARGLVKLAYLDDLPAAGSSSDAAPVVLIHGSPGDKSNFDGVLPELATHRRVLVPDLPGFGSSSRKVPDYSIRAHGRYVLEMLDALGIEEAHFVGFSLGGGVVLSIQDLAPQRVRSLSLVAATGVQELELLGDYHLNHALHGLQLAGLWLLREGVPHFGWLDDTVLGVPYARNFYDTDQRPLRKVLEQYDGPMLIVHGRNDVLVPIAAAREHHRLVPQSELQVLKRNHFFVFTRGGDLSGRLEGFFERVEAGEALTRNQAD